MAYERDDDRVTRGVGAIASADHVAPGRYRRRIESGMATRKRDRAMAAVAAGALSGVPLRSRAERRIAMGMTDRRQPPSDHRAVPVKAGTAITGPMTVRDHTTPGGGTGPLASGAGGIPPAAAPPPEPVQVKVPTSTLPPSMTPPPAPTASVPIPIVPTTVITTGTGPSTQGVAPRPPVTAIFDPVPSYPTTALDVPADNTTRNLMIAGGAALAAYLLFFRSRA